MMGSHSDAGITWPRCPWRVASRAFSTRCGGINPSTTRMRSGGVVTFDRLPKEELTPSNLLGSAGEHSAGYIHDGERESFLGRGEAEP